jgi:hypothetical protein
MLSVLMLSVVMMSVVMLNVVAPIKLVRENVEMAPMFNKTLLRIIYTV